MRSAPFPSAWDPRDEAFRRRAVSVVLAIGIHALLLLLLLRLAPQVVAPVAPSPRGITLDLRPNTKAEPDRSEVKAESKKERTKAAPARRAPERPKPVVQVPGPPAPSGSDIWSKVVPLSRRELAAVDTAVTREADDSEEAKAGGGTTGEQRASSAVVGTGPNGQPLYAAQWFRRPTDAQLAPYMPAVSPRTGWGMIICQTIANYRVDNCQELAQSPAGSGLAGAVRQAAWQFQVIPPRVGGRTMVGTWVRIRIDYTERGIR